MVNTMLRSLSWFAAPLALVSILGCSSGSSSDSSPPPPNPPAPTPPTSSNLGTISGRIADQGNSALGNVEVVVGTGASAKTAKTNEQGFFALDGVSPGDYAARFVRSGFVTNTKRVSVTADRNAPVSVAMQAIGTTQTIDASQVATVTHRGGSVQLPANGIVDSSGAVVTNVVAEVTTMVPGDPDYEVCMPGDFTGVDGGNRVDLISYGVIDVKLKDASGNALQLAQGATATLEFPLPPNDPNDPNDATIPLWWFDESSGDWIREGDVARDGAAGVYRGTVSHFTSWNCDKGRPAARKTVKLRFEGSPVIGVSVRVRGQGWLAGGVTDANGEVTMPVSGHAPPVFPAVADVLMLLPSGQWHVLRTGETMPGPDGHKINEFDETHGVVESAATVMLTWGERPSDLDSHMTIPTELRSHVFYGAKGALATTPWTNLDTDDVTSFGPEIITVTQPLEGVYRYCVHNYSGNGQHLINESGAVVTLVLKDQPTRTYNVPTENPGGGNFWAVFDLTYDASGNVTVTDVNQFGGQDLLRTTE